METTEHIVESFIRHVKHWYTNSNIKCKGGKEIDIIAVDAEGKKYHIECGVTHKKHWALKDKPSTDDVKKRGKTILEWKRKNSVDFFIKKKFGDTHVKQVLKDYGFSNKYEKIIVVWDVQSPEVIKYAREKNITVWCLKEKIVELMRSLGETYYEDDINRTLQLVWKAEFEHKKNLCKGVTDLVSNKKELKSVKQKIKELM